MLFILSILAWTKLYSFFRFSSVSLFGNPKQWLFSQKAYRRLFYEKAQKIDIINNHHFNCGSDDANLTTPPPLNINDVQWTAVLPIQSSLLSVVSLWYPPIADDSTGYLSSRYLAQLSTTQTGEGSHYV